MGRVSGWWLGACRVPSRGELASLAQAAGGWDALEGLGPDELVALGCPVGVADAWTSTSDGQTLGCAIPRTSPLYPAELAEDERAPPVLFVEGDPGALRSSLKAAIVGTRRCTQGGAGFARALATDLARGGAAVVSGLAMGIDAAAHLGAVEAGSAPTIAVLGHGLSHQSPRGNERLRRRIVASGGAVVSGWPDEQAPERWTFVTRNRWVAALSRAVVVVEAPVGSGALITARDAIELGVDVWVAGARPDDPASAGGLAMLREQEDADAQDAALLRLRLRQAVEGLQEGVCASTRGQLAAALRPTTRGRVRLLADRQALLQPLGIGAGERSLVPPGGVSPYELARSTGRDVREVQAELTRRELDGELVRRPSGRYDLL